MCWPVIQLVPGARRVAIAPTCHRASAPGPVWEAQKVLMPSSSRTMPPPKSVAIGPDVELTVIRRSQSLFSEVPGLVSVAALTEV